MGAVSDVFKTDWHELWVGRGKSTHNTGGRMRRAKVILLYCYTARRHVIS
jgi:hypothetical protein